MVILYRRMEIMKGMTLGLLDGIFSAITSAIMSVLSPLIEWIFNYILGPILNLFINLISYIVGIYLYGISSFLLGLIDFVELLFRALAGLDASNANSSIILSIDGNSGDILVQLIRHPSIQQAFLSMCIVGLFLLVVTTVFQIIKVEYTTEGAKNSKTPIFQKAFKGLANLMLIPILCVFGIIFSNQLLGLLDKATQGEGDNPTIAGTLFATAASDAHYRKSAVGDGTLTAEIHLSTTLPSLYPAQILSHVVEIAWNSIASSLEGTGWGNGDIVADYKNDEKTRNAIDTNFSNQAEGYCYYLIEDVTEYYDYSQINYLLLIFGGCVVLKCLYFTCFGMVIRLYKCAVLFIISPVVIGMTPTNEGGLGKWRGQFIGQVLSAYGTILSINLFFIIVRVLLNVELTFINNNSLGNSNFSSSLMTGLLKSIFVIAGCLLIEKFSKEIGGFFGAEDAMGAGKDMSKQVADVAMKGVQVAGAVGGAAFTGGASLAKAMKSGAKSAKGESTGIAGFVKGAGGFFAGGLKETASHTALGKGGMLAYSHFKDKNEINAGEEAKKNLEKNKTSLANQQSKFADLDKQEGEVQAQLEAARSTKGRRGNQAPTRELENRLKNIQEKKAIAQKNIDGLQASITSDEAAVKAGSSAQDRMDDRVQKRKDAVARTQLYASAIMAQSGEDVKGFIPGYKQFVQPLDKSAHSGVKLLGDDAEAAMGKIDKDKQKKVEDAWKENPTMASKAADTLLGSAARQYTKELAKEFEAAQKNIVVDARDAMMQLKDAIEAINSSKMSDDSKEQRKSELMQSTVDQLNSKGANVTYSQVSDWALNGKMDVNLADLKMDMDFDASKFEKAIQDAMKKSGGAMNADILRGELQKVFAEQGEKGNKNMLMQIEALIKKVMNDLK